MPRKISTSELWGKKIGSNLRKVLAWQPGQVYTVHCTCTVYTCTSVHCTSCGSLDKCTCKEAVQCEPAVTQNLFRFAVNQPCPTFKHWNILINLAIPSNIWTFGRFLHPCSSFKHSNIWIWKFSLTENRFYAFIVYISHCHLQHEHQCTPHIKFHKIFGKGRNIKT